MRGRLGRVWDFRTIPDLDVAGYVATGEAVDTRRELVTRSRDAMNCSLEFSARHPEAAREAVGEHLDVHAEARARMALRTFRTEFDRPALTALADAVLRYGSVDEPVGVDALLPALR